MVEILSEIVFLLHYQLWPNHKQAKKISAVSLQGCRFNFRGVRELLHHK